MSCPGLIRSILPKYIIVITLLWHDMEPSVEIHFLGNEKL